MTQNEGVLLYGKTFLPQNGASAAGTMLLLPCSVAAAGMTEEGALLWLAEYEASGRMTAFQQVIPAKDGTVVLFPCEDTARGSLLFLDWAWKPRACHHTIKC